MRVLKSFWEAMMLKYPKYYKILSASLSTFVGNGIARFSYTLFIPALISLNIFTPLQSTQLGAASLIGYIFGAPFVSFFKRYFSLSIIIKTSMLVCSISFFAFLLESMPFFYYYFWRFMAGVCGAICMILSAPLSLPYVLHKKALVSGIIFSGVGFGVVFASIFFPLILPFGMKYVFLFFGMLMLVIFLLSRFEEHISLKVDSKSSKPTLAFNKPMILLFVAYCLNAIGYIPHTLFWVDFLVREINITLWSASASFLFFGFGALLGALSAGFLAQKFSAKSILVLLFLIKALAVLAPFYFRDIFMLNASSFLVGFSTIGIVALVSALALQITSSSLHASFWGMLTFGFSIFQAFGGFSMSFLAQALQGYHFLFLLSSICLFVAFFLLLGLKPK